MLPIPQQHTTLLLLHLQLLTEAAEEILQENVAFCLVSLFAAAKMEILELKKVRGRWKEQEQSPGSADHSTAHQQHEQWENKQRTDNCGTDGGRQDRDSPQQDLHGAEAPNQAQARGQSPGLCHRCLRGEGRWHQRCSELFHRGCSAQEWSPGCSSLQPPLHGEGTGRGHSSQPECHLPPSRAPPSSLVIGENPEADFGSGNVCCK